MAKARTTIHDIAKELQITAATVSRALNGNQAISARTRQAVADAAVRLQYKPNQIAASLRTGKTFTVGVLVPAADRSFFGSIIRGIEEVLAAAHYSVIVAQTHEGQQAEERAVETLLRLQVDGILASVAKGSAHYHYFEKVRQAGVPLLFFDNVWRSMPVSSVIIDDYLGAYRATEHLIEQGCRRIVHLWGHRSSYLYQERLRGYKAALADAGIPIDDGLVYECKSESTAGQHVTADILAQHPDVDGIFSSSDFAAVGVLQSLQAAGIDVPGQIAIIGFANEPFTQFVTPALSTVDQHTHTMGQIAAELFLEEIQAKGPFTPHVRILEPDLVLRGSSLRKP